MCAYTFSAYVIVTQMIGVIIGVNRGAITKERKRSEGRSRNQTKEATQEAENEKKRRQGCCSQLMRWTKADDDAILAAGAALADRSIWQPGDCPNRGTVQGQDAKKRVSRLGK